MFEPILDHENLSIDFRTGLPTAITGKETGESQRAACAALNRKRARGIRKAAQGDAPGQPLSAHVWQTTFERKVVEWEVPLIPLESLGVRVDKDGFSETEEFLIPWLRNAVEDAKQFRETGKKPTYDLFDEIDDSEL